MSEKSRMDAAGVMLPESVCPVCSYALDAASVAGNDVTQPRPAAGDVSLCGRCGEVLEFGADMSLGPASVATMLALDTAAMETVERAQRVIRERRLLG